MQAWWADENSYKKRTVQKPLTDSVYIYIYKIFLERSTYIVKLIYILFILAKKRGSIKGYLYIRVVNPLKYLIAINRTFLFVLNVP